MKTHHNPTLKTFHNVQEARSEMERMGVHPRGIELMCVKAVFRIVKLEGVSSAAAHILKQEMLAADGEAATDRGTIDGTSSSTDVLLMGTDKAFNRLLSKLKEQPYGLPSIAGEIRCVLEYSHRERFRLRTSRRELEIGPRTLVMGVVNVTDDSFYPGSRARDPARAVDRAMVMVEEGVDIIDVGGESTRPGAEAMDREEELRRVIPVIESLASKTDIPISVDTRKASVASAALKEGAEIVNDVSGLAFDPCMAEVLAEKGAGVVISHSRGTPREMQGLACYGSLLPEIVAELRGRVETAAEAGVSEESVIVDPGLGFAKTASHNFQIIKHLAEFRSLGRPVMVGPSRKSFLSHDGELPPEQRLEESLAVSVAAALNGAHIIRTHDVGAIKKALWVVDSLR